MGIDALNTPHNWQPVPNTVDTNIPPFDGDYFIGFHSSGNGRWYVGAYFKSYLSFMSATGQDVLCSHWMPLPEPPKM